MPKGRLALPQGAKFREFVRANGARDQVRNVHAGGTARTSLGGVVRHRPPPGPAKASETTTARSSWA